MVNLILGNLHLPSLPFLISGLSLESLGLEWDKPKPPSQNAADVSLNVVGCVSVPKRESAFAILLWMRALGVVFHCSGPKL